MLAATILLHGVWKGSIDDVVRHDPRLTKLSRLIDASGYQPLLSGSSTSATLFAPIDAAFDRLPASARKAVFARRLAEPVLGAHLLRGLYGTLSFTNGTSAPGQPLRHDVSTVTGGHLRTVLKGTLQVNGAKIVGEIRATNGTILLVDRVLPLRLDPPRREGIAHEPPAELFRWGLALYER